MAVFDPIPRASAATAVTLNAGLLARVRQASRRSDSIIPVRTSAWIGSTRTMAIQPRTAPAHVTLECHLHATEDPFDDHTLRTQGRQGRDGGRWAGYVRTRGVKSHCA